MITKNEEANIGSCLAGLAFCDERIVVDSGSTDGTIALAQQKGARVYTHEWRGFGVQKNVALSLAQKALSDTVVRAPFSGIVAQRMVSTGDYVTKGMKVAEVVRITPLRVQLTVPEQFVKEVGVGQPVSLSVDAYPGRTFEGHVRYVSPSLRADQPRAR